MANTIESILTNVAKKTNEINKSLGELKTNVDKISKNVYPYNKITFYRKEAKKLEGDIKWTFKQGYSYNMYIVKSFNNFNSTFLKLNETFSFYQYDKDDTEVDFMGFVDIKGVTNILKMTITFPQGQYPTIGGHQLTPLGGSTAEKDWIEEEAITIWYQEIKTNIE